MSDRMAIVTTQANNLTEALGEEGRERFLSQILEGWIVPEIERRQAAGKLPRPFPLNMAQVLFPPDGNPHVRLNEEVRGYLYMALDREGAVGNTVYLDELENLHEFDLPDEDLDCGHITLIRSRGRWLATFNLVGRRGRVMNLLAKAEEFRQAAAGAHARGHASVAVDNLFSACELASKAELMAAHMLSEEVKSHGAVARKINGWRKLGNIDGAFVDLFNTLGQIRGAYRYAADTTEPMPVSNDDLELVAAVIDAGQRQVAPKRPPLPRKQTPRTTMDE